MIDKKKPNPKKEGKLSKPSTLPVKSKTDKKIVSPSKIAPNLKDMFKDYYQKD
ncbi:MAG: hypothetical protein WCG25_07480 [bacterium]